MTEDPAHAEKRMMPVSFDSHERPLLACISADRADRILLADLAAIAEYGWLGDWRWSPSKARSSQNDAIVPDIIFADLGSEMDLSESDVPELIRYCSEIGAKLVVSTDLESLDRRIGDLPQEQCQIVIGKNPAELVLALAMARGKTRMGRVFDPSKEYEAEELGRISNELASYARTLSRIARAEADGSIASDHLADKATSYHAPPPSVGNPFLPSGANDLEKAIDPAEIRELIRLRRLRDRFFSSELFADPAWDILLDLMAARLEGQKVSVSSLCIAAAVPATTALRWIKSMTDTGYLERRSDPTDARRVYICLSEETARKMAEYLRQRMGTYIR